MEIEWKPVQGFEERYLISNTGFVKSLMNRWGKRKQPKILAQRLDGKGYPQVRLYRDDGGKFYPKVHRLVANAFLPNPHNLSQINHIDENKTNNNVSNLEWCDGFHNMEHTFAKHYVFISPEGVVVNVFNLQKFCREKGLQSSNMSKVLKGERNHHKGWRKYV